MNEHWELMPVVRGFDSVLDIFNASRGKGYICGSYAAFMAAPIETPILPNDVDVFAISEQSAIDIFNQLYRYGPWELVGKSSIAYSIKNPRNNVSAQIVKPHPDWKTFPDDFLSAFDMDICRAALVSPNVVLADENVGRLQAKLLLINDPLRSLKRVMKYHARGVQLTDRELVKLFQAWELATPERRADILAIAQGQSDDPTEVIHVRDANSDGWDYNEDDYYRGE
jgi:hypothetical protein